MGGGHTSQDWPGRGGADRMQAKPPPPAAAAASTTAHAGRPSPARTALAVVATGPPLA